MFFLVVYWFNHVFLEFIFRSYCHPRRAHVKKKDMQYLYLKKDTLGIACPNPQYQEVLS